MKLDELRLLIAKPWILNNTVQIIFWILISSDFEFENTYTLPIFQKYIYLYFSYIFQDSVKDFDSKTA